MSRLHDLAVQFGSSGPRKGPVENDPRFDELGEMFENPHLLDWPKALDLGQKLIEVGGLDVRVLGFAGAAAFRVETWKGLADALRAWNHALDEAWPNVQPADPRKRMPAAARFGQTLHRWLVEAPANARPSDPDPIPAVTDPADVAACAEAGERFLDLVEQRFEGKVRAPRDVLARIRVLAEASKPAPPPPPKPAPPPPRPAPRPAPVVAAEAPEPSATDAPPPPAAPAVPTAARSAPQPDTARPALPPPAQARAVPAVLDDDALADGFRALRAAALPWTDALRSRDPARPEAWRIARDVAFVALGVPPSGRYVVPEAPDVAGLEAAVRSGDPGRIVETADSAWRFHLAWLDPHRHLADALRKLGHDRASDAVARSVRDLVKRLPEVLDAVYAPEGVTMRPDGSVGPAVPVPTADAETRRWATAEPAARPTAAPPVAAAPGTVPAPSDATDRDETARLAAFDAALAAGDLPAAFEAYSVVGRAARSPRDRAWLAAHAGGALIDAGRLDLALRILLAADELLVRHDIDTWEPDLAATILGKILVAARVGTDAVREERLTQLRVRLVRLGDLRGFTDR